MPLILITLAFALGLGIALHFAMNAATGVATGNLRMGNALFWCIGAVTAVCIGLSGYRAEFWAASRTVPIWLWLAGAMGACLVFGVVFLIPRLGAGTTNVVLLCGQVLGGLLIAHYGFLGSPVERINIVRLVGAVLLMLGASLAVLGRIPFR